MRKGMGQKNTAGLPGSTNSLLDARRIISLSTVLFSGPFCLCGCRYGITIESDLTKSRSLPSKYEVVREEEGIWKYIQKND